MTAALTLRKLLTAGELRYLLDNDLINEAEADSAPVLQHTDGAGAWRRTCYLLDDGMIVEQHSQTEPDAWWADEGPSWSATVAGSRGLFEADDTEGGAL